MRIVRKIGAWAVIGIASLVLVLFAMPTYRQGEASIAGKTAQDFPLEVWGKPGHLTDLKGKVVILHFWATWSPPCVEEKPALNFRSSMFPETYDIRRQGKILRKFFSSQQWDSTVMLAYFDAIIGQA